LFNVAVAREYSPISLATRGYWLELGPDQEPPAGLPGTSYESLTPHLEMHLAGVDLAVGGFKNLGMTLLEDDVMTVHTLASLDVEVVNQFTIEAGPKLELSAESAEGLHGTPPSDLTAEGVTVMLTLTQTEIDS